MEITTATGIDGGETTGPPETDTKQGNKKVEKGTGYGPPHEGSGEMVPDDEGIPSDEALKKADNGKKQLDD